MSSQVPSAPPPAYVSQSSDEDEEVIFGGGKQDKVPLIPGSSLGGGKGKTPGEAEEADLMSATVAEADIAIRQAFLRKVFGILSIQLLVTTSIAACFMFIPQAQLAVKKQPWTVFLGIFVSLGLLLFMMFKRHQSPLNFILLGAWTLVEGYTVGVVVSFYDTHVVLQAFVVTTVVVTALVIYTFQTKRDFTGMGPSLYAVLFALIIGGFMQRIHRRRTAGMIKEYRPHLSKMFFFSAWFDLLLSVGGAVLFSLYIVFDLQMMMQHVSPEEYIMATINLYLDILNLFLYILRIMQAFNRG